MAFYRCISTSSGKGSVEPFISSTGNQILTLPFYSDESITLSFDLLQCDYSQSNSVILGDHFDYDGVVLYADGNDNRVRMTHASDLSYTPTKWVWSHIEMDFVNCITKVDGVVVYSGSDTHQHYNQCLFGLSGMCSWCGIKNFKVYKSGNLFLNFTPMKDTITGEGYFHDEVSSNDYYANNPLVYCDEFAKGSSFEEVLHNGQVSTTAGGGAYMTASFSDISSHKYAIVKLYTNVSGTDYIGYYVVNIADIVSNTEVYFTINLHTPIEMGMTATAIRATRYGGNWEDIYADVAVSDTELF